MMIWTQNLQPKFTKIYPFYTHNLELSDYQHMATVLAGIKSRFILSINDHPDIREGVQGIRDQAGKLEIYGLQGKADDWPRIADFELLTARAR